MTKLLLNTGSLLHDAEGRPVPPGQIVLSDEMETADELEAQGALVHVKPSDLPEDLGDALLSEAALEHAWRGRNAEASSGDDAPVSTSTRTRRGGQS